MGILPLNPQPAQSLQAVLGPNSQQCQISVYTKTGYVYTDDPVQSLTTPGTNLYFDLTVNGTVITTCAICLNRNRLLINRQYFGVVGDFVFVDTQGDSAPQYQGLGSRFLLVYLDADDLAAIDVANAAAA